MPNTMSMTCIKKHSNFLKSTMLGLFAFAVIASPLSVSFLNAPISNVAYADTTPPAGVVDECGSGKHADWSVLQASMSYSSYVALGVALTSGGAAAKQAWDQIKANANVCVDNTTGKTSSVPQSCSSVLMFMSSPFVCMFRSLVTLTAGSLIYISSWILSLAALLFNWLIDHTVIGFGELYTTIKPAVETAWTAFRDIANILIIGMFVFIAISIILGLKEYGQKRLIANVLIIAVLINFSLLFTKMIIDASNFTATQVYTAAKLGGTSTAGPASTAKANYGIADQFLYLLGVGTYGDSLKLVYDTAEAKDSGWAALGHGIIVMIVLLGAALVILYGCFLLVSRMLMLIFLMITASVAFASYLIPAWAKSAYGWKAWWSSLLWCAAFAPILVLLLWTTLNISYALKGTSKATLGAALSDPTGGGNTEALFMYVIVLGLLFISFKISSMTAGEIGGFSWAQMGPGIGLGLAGLATGMVGRTLGGWAASRGLTAMRNRGLSYQTQTGQWVGGASSGPASRFLAARLAGLQKASFNPLKTKTVGSVASTFGIPKVLSGAKMGEGGFEGVMARKAKAADELARKIGPTGPQRDQAERETRQARRDQVTQMNELIRTQKETREGLLNRQPGARDADTALTQARNALTTREHERDIAGEEHASRLRIQEARAANAQDPAERQNANTEIQRLNAERHEAMAGEAQRIEAARQAVTQRQATIDQNHPEIAELTRTIEANTNALGDENTRGTLKHAASDAQVGRDLHKADAALRESLLWDPRAASKIEDEMKAHGRRQFAADMSAAITAAAPATAAAVAAAAPAAPAAAPPTPPAAH